MTWKYANKFEPLYFKIQREIIDDIQDNKYRPGDKLPSENEIAEKYGVSVITSKRVLKNLVDMGIAYIVKGKGTYLAKAFSFPSSGWSFTEQMRYLGLTPSSQILRFEVTKPDPDICSILNVSQNEDVFYLKRIRLANNHPIGLELSIIPVDVCPDLKTHDLEKESLFKILKEEYQIETVFGDAEISAAPATEEEAECLRIPRNSPVIKQKRVHFAAEFVPFEYLQSTFQSKNRLTFISGRFRMIHPFQE